MDITAGLIIVAIFLWNTVSARLTRADLTAPIVFVAIGALLATFELIDEPSAPETLKPLVEVTLIWVLFSAAARVPIQKLRHDLGRYLRLLGLGLPLTVVAGWGLATWLFPDLGVWLALLNDGIVTSVVMLAIVTEASAEGRTERSGLGEAPAELATGALVGGVVGLAGGWLLRWARRRGWTAEEFTGIAVLALAFATYGAALVLNGKRVRRGLRRGGRQAGTRVAGVPRAGRQPGFPPQMARLRRDRRPDLSAVLYAVLSRTLVRMVPVALASWSSGLDRNTVLFVGWFGPRGLASLVFALLALEELGADADDAVAIIGLTVLMSVLAHGLSAGPLAARYGRAAARSPTSRPRPATPSRQLSPRATDDRHRSATNASRQVSARRPQP